MRKDVARDKEEADGRTLTSRRFTSFHHHEHLIHSSPCDQLTQKNRRPPKLPKQKYIKIQHLRYYVRELKAMGRTLHV